MEKFYIEFFTKVLETFKSLSEMNQTLIIIGFIVYIVCKTYKNNNFFI